MLFRCSLCRALKINFLSLLPGYLPLAIITNEEVANDHMDCSMMRSLACSELYLHHKDAI